MPNAIITNRTYTGKTIKAGEIRLTPLSKSLSVRPNRLKGFFIWSRPHAIHVEDEQGVARTLAIPDLTRWMQFIAFSFGLAVGVFALFLSRWLSRGKT